jgi:O-antigen/teichoic acid export membrane protein
LARNILANVVGQAVVMALAVAAARSLFRGAGEDAFGVVYFVQALNTTLTAALDLGMGATLVREISLSAERDPGHGVRMARTAGVFYWGLLVAVATVLLLAAPAVGERWLRLSTLSGAEAVWAIRVLSLGSLSAFPRTLYASVLRGRQRLDVTSGLDVAGAVVQHAGVLAVVGLGGGLRSIVIWLAFSASLSAGLHAVAVARLMGKAALVPSFESDVFRRSWGYARQMALVSALSTVQSQADRLLVGSFFPVGIFGHYSYASSAVNRLAMFSQAVAQAALPSLSEIWSVASRERLLAQYWKLQDFVCYSTGPLLGIVPFVVLPVFGIVFTPEVARTLIVPTSLLALGFYLNGTLQIPYMVILATGRLDIMVRWSVVAMLVVMPMTAGLIYRFGLTGAGLSCVLFQVAASLFMVPPLCEGSLGIRPALWYAHTFRPVGLFVAAYGGAWLAMDVIGNRTVASLSVAYLAGTAVFTAAAAALVGAELREVLRRLLAGAGAREGSAGRPQAAQGPLEGNR